LAENDLSSLAAIRIRFTAIVALSFIVMPFIAHAAAATFNLAGWADLQFAMQQGILPLFIGFMLFWIIRYAWLLFSPIEHWLHSTRASRFAPADIHQRLQNFGRNYWGFYLCYVLVARQIYFWSTTGGHGFELATFGQLILLQLVVAILVGLPLYLMAIDTLGRVVSIIGITAPICQHQVEADAGRWLCAVTHERCADALLLASYRLPVTTGPAGAGPAGSREYQHYRSDHTHHNPFTAPGTTGINRQ